MAEELEEFSVRCDRLAPVVVRRRLDDLRDLGWLVGDAMLVATELVTNAVRHSLCSEEDRLVVSVHRETSHVRVSVRDPGRSGRTARISEDADPFGGLGLRIVAQLSTRWGSERDAAGYQVWAELPLLGQEADLTVST